eukprot:258494-Pleurochrysis_carterae.AAC.3
MVRELERVELELRRRERAELVSLRAQLAHALRGSAAPNAAAGDVAASVSAPAPTAAAVPVAPPPGSPPHAAHLYDAWNSAPSSPLC